MVAFFVKSYLDRLLARTDKTWNSFITKKTSPAICEEWVEEEEV
jgi:hypothetical protein